jgi:hypothetical protein
MRNSGGKTSAILSPANWVVLATIDQLGNAETNTIDVAPKWT